MMGLDRGPTRQWGVLRANGNLPGKVCLIQVAATRRTSGVHSYIMPKQKTHKGTKKRFRLTAKGKAKHRQSGTSHLAARMSHKRKRNLRGTAVVDHTDGKRIAEALCGNGY